MTRRRCAGITKAGTACGFPASPGRPYCLNHDPERRDELTESKRRGGYNRRARIRAGKLLAAGVTTLADVHQELLLAFVRLRDGDLDIAVCLAMATLARALKDTALSADYEAQLRDIRAELARIATGGADAHDVPAA